MSIKVYGNTFFSAEVRSIVENDEEWEIAGGELVNSCGDIFIPFTAASQEMTEWEFTCVIEMDGEFYTPFTSYFCIDANGDTRQINFC